MDIFHNLWQHVLQYKTRLSAGGAFFLGILLTLSFKELYPDLELSFQRRMRRLQGADIPHPLPGQPDYVRLEDHTRRKSQAQGDRQQSGGLDERIKVGIEGLVGHTPLVKIKSLSEATGCEILAKAEYLNGAGNSPKDRVALSMIDHAEEEGLLVPGRGDAIYEGTVGSTGISLAAVCRARGYKAHMYVESHYIAPYPRIETTCPAACPTTKQPRNPTCC